MVNYSYKIEWYFVTNMMQLSFRRVYNFSKYINTYSKPEELSEKFGITYLSRY